MSNIISKYYDTTLEIIFAFENSLNIKFNNIFFHTHNSIINDKALKPYYIVLFDTSNNKYTYTFQEIINTINHIPIYNSKTQNNNEFSMIDLNDKIIPIRKNDKNYTKLNDIFNESYNNIIPKQHINETLKNNIITLLDDIPYKVNEYDIELFPESKYNIKISMNKSNEDRNIIVPKINEYSDTTTLGHFIRYDGDNVSLSNYHLAIIKPCMMCERKMIYDWFSINKNYCPCCGNNNEDISDVLN